MCWQRSCPAGTIDCGTYCAPATAGSCANFIGATWQNCRAKSGRRRAVQELPYALPYLPNVTEYRSKLDCEANPLDCFCLAREPGAYANQHGPATSYVVCALQVRAAGCAGCTVPAVPRAPGCIRLPLSMNLDDFVVVGGW